MFWFQSLTLFLAVLESLVGKVSLEKSGSCAFKSHTWNVVTLWFLSTMSWAVPCSICFCHQVLSKFIGVSNHRFNAPGPWSKINNVWILNCSLEYFGNSYIQMPNRERLTQSTIRRLADWLDSHFKECQPISGVLNTNPLPPCTSLSFLEFSVRLSWPRRSDFYYLQFLCCLIKWVDSRLAALNCIWGGILRG